MTYDQSEYEVRCEWGVQGVAQLAHSSDVVIIVDVLSFSTCVEIAVTRGALIFPFRDHSAAAKSFADSMNAELAGARRSSARYLLSPRSLLDIPAGTRLVLPSPNGATLSLATGSSITLAGCLRNARAVALAAQALGKSVAVIPAGERWSDGSLRPAIEDWLGAGAIIDALDGTLSPEARAARLLFRSMRVELPQVFAACSSGKELIEQGFARDVELASVLNAGEAVPRLQNGAYTAAASA